MAELIVYGDSECAGADSALYATYAAAREALEAESLEKLSGQFLAASQNYDSEYGYWLMRTLLYFDCSALPTSFIVTNAVLSLRSQVCAWGDSFHDFDEVVVSGADLNYPPVLADYGDILNDTISRGSISGLAVPLAHEGYADITLNAIGRSEIIKGMTKFALRSSRDIDGITPTEREAIWFFTAQAANQADLCSVSGPFIVKPKLTITYTTIGSIQDGTGTLDVSPQDLVVGDNTLTVTEAGTFIITVAQDGSCESGTAIIEGSPIILPAGETTTVNAETTGTFKVIINARWRNLADTTERILNNFTGRILINFAGRTLGNFTGRNLSDVSGRNLQE